MFTQRVSKLSYSSPSVEPPKNEVYKKEFVYISGTGTPQILLEQNISPVIH
jgi:hypothetical protein